MQNFLSNFPRLNKFLKWLPKLAVKSDINHQHAAVLMQGGSPVAWGFNTIKGAKTFHAEMSVIQRFMTSRGFQSFGKSGYRVLWNSEKHECPGKATKDVQESFTAGHPLEWYPIYYV